MHCTARRTRRGEELRAGVAKTTYNPPVSNTYPISKSAFSLRAIVIHSGESFVLSAIIDSGSEGNFIEETTALRLHLPLKPLRRPVKVNTIDGGPIGTGVVTHSTEPITLQVSSLHQENIILLVTNTPRQPIILSAPWLQLHDPTISWRGGEIMRWSEYCHGNCLRLPTVHVTSTSIESPETKTKVNIPKEYHEFIDVFSKAQVSGLPPHRPYDCEIDLLPGTTPTRGRIYPLSLTEQKAMEEYVQEALEQGYIEPSTSLASAVFFFVVKKGGGLRPCIDYRNLNKITIKYQYPLPLVPAALELLRKARVFTKLDLQSAYNFVRIRQGDEWKTAFSMNTGHYQYKVMVYGLSGVPSVFQSFINDVLRDMLGKYVIAYIDDILIYSKSYPEHVNHVKAVLAKLRENQLFVKGEKCQFHVSTVRFLGYVISTDGVVMEEEKVSVIRNWPKPLKVKELQRFLGFANFYRRFIRNFSTIAAPLTSMTKRGPHTLRWTPEAEAAFYRLKQAFSMAPILKHPDRTFRSPWKWTPQTLGSVPYCHNAQGKSPRCTQWRSSQGN